MIYYHQKETCKKRQALHEILFITQYKCAPGALTPCFKISVHLFCFPLFSNKYLSPKIMKTPTSKTLLQVIIIAPQVEENYSYSQAAFILVKELIRCLEKQHQQYLSLIFTSFLDFFVPEDDFSRRLLRGYFCFYFNCFHENSLK